MERHKALSPIWILLAVAVAVCLMVLLGMSGRNSSVLDKPVLRLDGSWSYESEAHAGTIAVGQRPEDLGLVTPGNLWVEFSTQLPTDYSDPHSLLFSNMSHRVVVKVDGRQIYSYGYPPQFNPRIPVGGYHLMPIPSGSQGLELTIRFECPPGIDTIASVPSVTIGQGYTLLARAIVGNLPWVLMSLVILTIGLALCGVSLWSYTRRIRSEGVAFFGLFALMVGLWSLLSTNVPQLLTGNHQTMMALKFTCIMLCAVPFANFVMHVFNPKRPWIFRILAIVLMANYILTVVCVVVLQPGAAMSLLPTHFLVLLTCALVLWTFISAVREKTFPDAGWFLGSFALLTVGVAIDIVRYSLNPVAVNNAFFMASMLIFTLVTGWKTSTRLADSYMQGVKAETYERIAFTDILTGMPNRTAFDHRLETLRGDARQCSQTVLVMLDLDHLKRINDTFGHKAGDNALRKVTSVIQTVYSRVDGQCYRIGGDEFVVVLGEKGLGQVAALEKELGKRLEEANASSMVPLSVSCGYAVGSMADSSDPYLILERADAMMYRCKQT
jgi:diguanylate cyclase (GGDEF)-like protein